MQADVFFVDGTAFLLTMSQRIKFITTEHVPVRTAKSLAKHVCVCFWPPVMTRLL